MGMMDFLKGLFSSSNEDQGVNNISESGSTEPTPAEPQTTESTENTGGADNSSSQE
jgi:hypothetical protein